MADTNASAGIDWAALATNTAKAVMALAPLVAAADPALAPAIALGEKIAQGALAGESTAVALYKQIVEGTPPSPAQLQAIEANYDAAYIALKADIAAKLASSK